MYYLYVLYIFLLIKIYNCSIIIKTEIIIRQISTNYNDYNYKEFVNNSLSR